ncbi:uncharacterized protein LOC111898095 [Lactuca sativa]|uniref:uncharacterized protein LOC111898095 n=1 Tax=Lactuca sativa TaxID=4236 RepID=UPI0022B06CF4|nr:uncharacterized protein LOC111898095 [Lactuca sativa]
MVGKQHGRDAFVSQEKQSISEAFKKQTKIKESNYKLRLGASIWCCKFLLKNGLPFRGHDESSDSLNRGIFLELLSFLRDHNEGIRNVTLENAPQNNQVTCPRTQKKIFERFSTEIVLDICKEIGKDVFSLLVDEFSDVSKKEQMDIVLRYVENRGVVKERFIGVVHVKDTSSMTLKAAIDYAFTHKNLSMSQVIGQGYDGESNMQGAFGLKALILQYNHSTHYVHCFAHQLQLVIVGVAKKHDGVANFFEKLSLVLNVVGGSCKRKDMLLENQGERVQMSIGNGELETGRGLNQESSLIRAGDIIWGSHFKTITSLMNLFAEVRHVLTYVKEKGSSLSNQNQAFGILKYFKTLDFMFYLHLMYEILHLMNVFSKNLQKKDQDILEAASLVRGTMDALKSLRDTGFAKLLSKLYTKDFGDTEKMQLDGELKIYYHALHKDDRFTSLQGISDLSRLMVETGKHRSYHMVYRLLKLVLVLPVATTTVGRCFSTMKFLKKDLRNKIGDGFLNDVMISYVEKEALMKVNIEDVMDRFQKMCTHRCQI